MGEPGFPQAFAEALVRRGVSLAWLQERLVERGHPVSPAALSYWRSGRSQPERGTSLDALVEIERLLRVEPGHLVARLGPSRRPGPRPGEKNIRDLFDETPAMQRALTELGFEGLFDELVEHLRHITVDLDDQGRATVDPGAGGDGRPPRRRASYPADRDPRRPPGDAACSCRSPAVRSAGAASTSPAVCSPSSC